MIYKVNGFGNPFEENKLLKRDCLLSSLIATMKITGVNLSLEEIILSSKALRLELFDVNSTGTLKVMGLMGISRDLLRQFANTELVSIEHYSKLDKNEDFQHIVDALKNNCGIIAQVDMYDFMYTQNPNLKKYFPQNRHMTLHYVIIDGVDTDSNTLHIQETMLKTFKEKEFWIDYDDFDKTRICNWLDFNINREIFIIKEKGKTQYVLNKKDLVNQLNILKHDAEVSISKIYELFDAASRNQKYIDRYWRAITAILDMSVWFDPSGYFFRKYLSNIVSSIVNDTTIKKQYEQLADCWGRFCIRIRKIKNTNDCINIWKDLIDIIRKEFDVHVNTISLLK